MESGDSDAAPMILTNEVSRAFLSLGYHYSERDKKLKEWDLKKLSSRWVRGAPNNSTALIITDDEIIHN
jgi:hypothetical protein